MNKGSRHRDSSKPNVPVPAKPSNVDVVNNNVASCKFVVPCDYCTTGVFIKEHRIAEHIKLKHPVEWEKLKLQSPPSPIVLMSANGSDGRNSAAGSRSDDEDNDEQYVVERVLKHKSLAYLKKRDLLNDSDLQFAEENRFPDEYTYFKVKWKFWDNPEDLTWEPRMNLEENKRYAKYLDAVPAARYDGVPSFSQKPPDRNSSAAVITKLSENSDIFSSKTDGVDDEEAERRRRKRERKERRRREEAEAKERSRSAISSTPSTITNGEPPLKKKFMSTERAEQRNREASPLVNSEKKIKRPDKESATENSKSRSSTPKPRVSRSKSRDRSDSPKLTIATDHKTSDGLKKTPAPPPPVAAPAKVEPKKPTQPQLFAVADEVKIVKKEVKPEATKQVRPPLGPIPKEFTNESMRPILEDPQLVAWLERRTKPTKTLENRHASAASSSSELSLSLKSESKPAQLQARTDFSTRSVNPERILEGLQGEIEALDITAQKRTIRVNYPFPTDDMTDLIRYQLAQMKNGIDGKKELVVHFLSLSRNEHVPMVDRLEAAALVGDPEGLRFFQLFDQWHSLEKQKLPPPNTDDSREEQEKAAEKLTTELVQKLIEETTDKQTGVNLLMNLSWTRDKNRPCCSAGVPNQCRLLQFLSKYCGGKLLNKQTVKSKWTALMVAVNSGAPCQIAALLQNDAYVTMRNSNKRTAFFLAIERRDLQLCQWLLWNGADPHVVATDPQIGRDCTPLTLAEQYPIGCPLIASWLIRRCSSLQTLIRDWVADVCKVSMRNYIHPLYPLLFWHSFRPLEKPINELEMPPHTVEFKIASTKKLLERLSQRVKVKPLLFIFAAYYDSSDEHSAVDKPQLKLMKKSDGWSPSFKRIYVNGDDAQAHLKMSEQENCWITTFTGLREGSNTIQLLVDTSTMPSENRGRLILFFQPWACRHAIGTGLVRQP